MRSATGISTTQRPARLWRLLQQRPISHNRLMEASEERLNAATHSEIALEALIAARITGNAKDFSRWECQHSDILQRIVASGSRGAQKHDLLCVSLSLIHRKALFEYLRANEVRDERRVRLIKHFFRCSDYSRAVVQEHGNYLRAAASLLCSSYLGTCLLLDDVFDQPLLEYEQLYAEYFRIYCELVTPIKQQSSECMEPLLLSLKLEISEWRTALLALADSHSGIWRAPDEIARLRNTN